MAMISLDLNPESPGLRAHLACGKMRDSYHGCAADKLQELCDTFMSI